MPALKVLARHRFFRQDNLLFQILGERRIKKSNRVYGRENNDLGLCLHKSFQKIELILISVWILYVIFKMIYNNQFMLPIENSLCVFFPRRLLILIFRLRNPD